MASKKTTHLRVREGTLVALQQLLEEMAEGVRKGRGKRFWGDGPLTLAALVEELVTRELSHRARSRKASAGKREPMPVPQLVDPEGDRQDAVMQRLAEELENEVKDAGHTWI